jgi:hypothetical protein
MDLDDVVLVIDAQMPIQGRRLVFHEDPVLRATYESQTGDLPWPPVSKAAAPLPPEPDDPVAETIEPTPPQPSSGPQATAALAGPQPAVRLVASAAEEVVASSQPDPVRLAASERRAVLTRARAVVFVQPLEAVVKPEHLPAIRAAMRKIQMPDGTPQVVPRKRAAPAKREALVRSARRAAVGPAKPVILVQLVGVGGGPEVEAALRTANANAIRVRDMVFDDPPAPLA